MAKEEYADVCQLWALCNATGDFELVGDVCDDLLAVHTDREKPVYRALLTYIYVAYNRPFNSKPKLLFLKNKLPAKHQTLHKQMVEHRNQIYAHTARDGPLKGRFNVNRVTVVRQRGGRLVVADKILSLPQTVRKVKELAECMCKIAYDERDKLLDKHEDKFPMGKAVYLNVTDPNGPFVLPAA